MWESIMAIFTWIIDAFFGEEGTDGNRSGGLIEKTVDGVSAIGSGIWDWFADDSVSLGTKAAVAGGLAYLIAPDTTTKIVSNAVDGVTKTAGNVLDSGASLLAKYWWIPAGILAFFILKDD